MGDPVADIGHQAGLDVSRYSPGHGRELLDLWDSTEWRLARQGGLVEEVRSHGTPPGGTRDYVRTVVDQLLAFNRERAQERIRAGERDSDALLETLAVWPPGLAGKDPLLSFLGITLTTSCNFDPRCIYCNQTRVERRVTLDGWKQVVAEATASNGGSGPYIYLTGGEPLLLRDDIWGDHGLVRFASERGAAVNVNTNATLLTAETALRLIKSGVAKLHISIDSADPDVQESLFGGRALEEVLQGIYNVQIARDAVGVGYPVIHTNCVLTRRNLDLFPSLFGLILEKRKRLTQRRHPLYYDLFPHIIPVGGDANASLRPVEEDFRRFYEEVWPKVEEMWRETQVGLGVAKDQQGPMFGYFSSPFGRVRHQGGLEAYAKASAEGHYGRLALSRFCYVAPTQASFGPDGAQFRCGSHAIRRIHPVGRTEGGLLDNIRSGVDGQEAFPNADDCFGCALATLYINQAVEERLRKEVNALLANRLTAERAENAGGKAEPEPVEQAGLGGQRARTGEGPTLKDRSVRGGRRAC